MKNPVSFLKKAALFEAGSFLILLFIAMPLKYIWQMPIAVQVVGMAHGILFILFCGALLQTTLIARWPMFRSALIFIVALLPFGPFFLDRRMTIYEQEFQNRRFKDL